MVSHGQYSGSLSGFHGDVWLLLLMLCPAVCHASKLMLCPALYHASKLRWVLFSAQRLLGNGLPHCWQQYQWQLLIIQLPLRDQWHAHRYRDMY